MGQVFPENNGARCQSCQIGLPINIGKFHHNLFELVVFYAELENVTVKDGIELGASGKAGENPAQGGGPKVEASLSHSETKTKSNVISYFKVNVSDTKLDDGTSFNGYKCLKCFFEQAKEKDLNRLANVLRNHSLDFRPIKFNYGDAY